jgi:hypothetical protein
VRPGAIARGLTPHLALAQPARTKREALDYYPTPRIVTHVVARWLVDAGALRGDVACLDPAGGVGDLILGVRDVPPMATSRWHAIEIDATRARQLEDVADDVIVGDALSVEWPRAMVLSNPPFSLLDAFWLRMAEHCLRHRTWGAMFTPVAWWNAEKRASYRRPDVILNLGWRPSFRPQEGPAHKGSQDFCWSILAPEPRATTHWHRVEKPDNATATWG